MFLVYKLPVTNITNDDKNLRDFVSSFYRFQRKRHVHCYLLFCYDLQIKIMFSTTLRIRFLVARYR